MKIKDEVLEVLNNSKLEENTLYLPVQLERKLYQDVNKILELLGGKWNRKFKGHVFDIDVEELLNDAINFGEIVDHKKELQFYPTPKDLVNLLVDLSEIEGSEKILEPSAGNGAIVSGLLNKGIRKDLIDVVEIDKNKEKDLWLLVPDGQVLIYDFLETEITPIYDRVIMNPPFSGQQDIDHILQAYKFLKENGILVSIVSESPFFRNNKKSVDFRLWLDNVNAEVIDLEPGAFKESGTMVKTRIIKVHK